MNGSAYGFSAEFASADQLKNALRQIRVAGYTHIEAFTPYPVDGLGEWLPGGPTPMARIMAIAAMVGAGGGYFLQWFAARDFPLNVGGRPLHSWPAFIPITFELTVLTTALVGVVAFLWIAGLPRLDHPLFGDPRFRRASEDRFFLCVRTDDPVFEEGFVRRVFTDAAAESVEEVAL